MTIAYIGEADKEICNWTQFTTASNAYKEINGDPQKQQYHTPSDGSEFVQNLDGWYAVYIRYTDENGKAVSIYKTINVTDTALVVRPEAVANGADIVINAKLLADALHVPLIECSHQQGHVAASLWSASRMELMDQPH